MACSLISPSGGGARPIMGGACKGEEPRPSRPIPAQGWGQDSVFTSRWEAAPWARPPRGRSKPRPLPGWAGASHRAELAGGEQDPPLRQQRGEQAHDVLVRHCHHQLREVPLGKVGRARVSRPLLGYGIVPALPPSSLPRPHSHSQEWMAGSQRREPRSKRAGGDIGRGTRSVRGVACPGAQPPRAPARLTSLLFPGAGGGVPRPLEMARPLPCGQAELCGRRGWVQSPHLLPGGWGATHQLQPRCGLGSGQGLLHQV